VQFGSIRLRRAIALVSVATLAMAGIAFADTVTVTNSVGINDNVTKAPGTSGTGYVRLDTTNGTPAGDANGCNATGGEPLTVNLASDNLGVTLTDSSVVLGGCVEVPFGYTVGAAATGMATISVSSFSGGRDDGVRLYQTTDTLVITISAPSDTTAPTNAAIAINDAATWTNSANVTVDISATDNVGVTRFRLAETQADLDTAADVAVSPAEASFSRSNLAFALTDPDAASKAVWLRVFDAAGNSADANDTIGLDRVGPDVTCVAASFLLNQPSAQVSANVTDGLSGAVNATESAAAVTTSAGSHSVSIAGTDNAGNSTTETCSYTVGFTFDGLYAPVDRPNVTNVSKAGQAIPLKWRITDYFGAGVTNLSSVKVQVTATSCAAGTSPDLIEEIASGSSGLQNLGDGYYQFNWKTPTSYASSCKNLGLDLGEGAVRTNLAYFSFKK
jgi:hypothetical protein